MADSLALLRNASPSTNVLGSWLEGLGEQSADRILQFFTAEIRNPNTRRAYLRALVSFVTWCNDQHITLRDLTPYYVAAYIEQLGVTHSPPTVKQHLAAIRMLGDYLVVGQIVPHNPAAAVRGTGLYVHQALAESVKVLIRVGDCRHTVDNRHVW